MRHPRGHRYSTVRLAAWVVAAAMLGGCAPTRAPPDLGEVGEFLLAFPDAWNARDEKGPFRGAS